MSGSYASNKKSIYTWRDKNRDKWNEYRRNYVRSKKIWLEISIELRNILLED